MGPYSTTIHVFFLKIKRYKYKDVQGGVFLYDKRMGQTQVAQAPSHVCHGQKMSKHGSYSHRRGWSSIHISQDPIGICIA